MNILYNSQGPYSPEGEGITTGFSKMGHATATQLAETHNVSYIAHDWQGLPFRHFNYDIHRGNKNFTESASEMHMHVNTKKYDAAIYLGELWGTVPFGKIPWSDTNTKLIYHVCPDGTPIDKNLISIKDFPDVLVPMTNWAKNIMEENNIPCYKAITASYDPTAYCQLKKDQKDEIRTKLGLDDKFVVHFTGRQQARKNIMSLIIAFEKFARDKDDAILLLTITIDQNQDFDLPLLIKLLGIEDKVKICSLESRQMLSDEELGNVFNATDVYFTMTCSEGFNMPVMESQACGVPAIVPDYSAHLDLVEDCGLTTEIEFYKEMDNGIHWAFASIDNAVENLNSIYESKQLQQKLSNAAKKKMLTYTNAAVQSEWNYVVENIDEIIEEIESRKGIRRMSI